MCGGSVGKDDDAEVAVRKGISMATVHSHRQRIMAKLDLHRTAELMRWAAEKGFVHVALPSAPCCWPAEIKPAV